MQRTQVSKTLKSIPKSVQLPGGISLKGLLFKCIDYNEDGSPKVFELQKESPLGDLKLGEWVLFASEEQIRSPGWKDRT